MVKYAPKRRLAAKTLCAFALGVALGLALNPAAWGAEPLRIAAAADLQPVLPSILADFTRQTGIQAEASYQSSATLEQQIENGAAFDVFMAADTSFPRRVIAAGLAEQDAAYHLRAWHTGALDPQRLAAPCWAWRAAHR